MSPRDAQPLRKNDVSLDDNAVNTAEVVRIDDRNNNSLSNAVKEGDRTADVQQQQRGLINTSNPSSTLGGMNSMMGHNTYDPYSMGGSTYMYGGGGLGLGGMGMSPYMMNGLGMMTGHPGITNVLFNFQQIMFSISQAVQIVGMNAEALQQLVHSLRDLTMKANESIRGFVVEVTKQLDDENKYQIAHESEKQKKRRRRLKVLRWTMAMVGSYAMYKFLKRIFCNKRKHRELIMNYHDLDNRHRRYGNSINANQNLVNNYTNGYGSGSNYHGHGYSGMYQ